MKKILRNIMVASALLASCNFCKATLITVESYTDTNGFFSYTIEKGDEPFLFGGGSNLCFQIQSYSATNIYDPLGWKHSTSSSGIISWKFTNENATTIDLPIQFSLQSDITDFVNYNQIEQNVNYPLGIIFGDIYNTNKTLYLPNGNSSNNFSSSSVNITGYERFEFVGPIIPEPTLCFFLCLTAFTFRKFYHNVS